MKITLILAAALLLTSTSSNAQVRNEDLPAVAQAMAHFNARAAEYGLSNPAAELKARRSRRDERFAAHIRFDQIHRGLKVFEGEAIAHVETDGNVTVTNGLRRGLNVTPNAAVNRRAALATAAAAAGMSGDFSTMLDELQILPRGERSAADRLVWHFQFFREDDNTGPARVDVFVDANSGAVVWQFDSLETSAAVGVGRTMYSGDQSLNTDSVSGTYYLRDLTRSGNQTIDMNRRTNGGTLVSDAANNFGDSNTLNTDADTAGADAHYAMQQTWDYFKNAHGRNGIDNAGTATRSRVHYGRNYENAFWSDSCFCMTYGDGASTFYPLVSIDVGGHEMAHGVTSREANLTYSGESGGLNEATSDIFGTMVEFVANSTLDTPDWWIGERIYRSNYSSGSFVQTRALRYMDDPAKDGRSPACWSSTLGSLNVHYSSGPANHMFYLLAAGGTSKCNGRAVSGIGNDKAARIWYKALADYMTASTNYAGARTAALNAATALFGAASAERAAVAAAFSAINVN